MREDRKKQLTKAAYLYYVKDKTQAEIAEELNVYRTTVSRMLAQAKKEGLVEIKIKDFDSEIFTLETYVKEKYGLKFLEIVPNDTESSEEEKERQLAKAAGSVIRNRVNEDDVIGLAWGSAVGNAVNQVENRRLEKTTVVPIVGGPSHINSKYHVNTLVYELARRFQGKSLFVNATVVQENQALKEGIFDSQYFSELRSYWQKLDIVFVGIGGSLDYQKSQWRDLLTQEDLQDLRSREAIGDCCCRFFDAQGEILKGDLYDRTIGLPLEELKHVTQSIGITRGKQKSAAILALLKKQYINGLVTDQETALAVLELDNDQKFTT